MIDLDTFDEVSQALGAHNRRKGARDTVADVTAAIVRLRAQQFLFESRNPVEYAILRSMAPVLETSFRLHGARLVYDDVEAMIGLEPMEDVSRVRLTVEQTLVLLALRWIFETRVEMREIEHDGSVRAGIVEIVDTYVERSRRREPKLPVVRAALELLETRNIVQIGRDADEEDVVFIRSAIRRVTDEDYMNKLVAFAQAAEGRASRRAARGLGADGDEGSGGEGHPAEWEVE